MKQLLKRITNNSDYNKKDYIRTLLISEGFGFCFSLSCVWGYTLDKYGTVCGSASQILCVIGISILLTQIVSVFLCLFTLVSSSRGTISTMDHDNEAISADSSLTVNRRLWLLVSLIILVSWIPTLLAYYPAIFSYDAEAQLYQVISRNYSTHHPLIHTLFMGACMKLGFTDHGIGPGMTIYACVQMIIMAAILGWTAAELDRIRVHRGVIIGYLVWVMFMPVNSILAISTTKDVVFAGLVVLYVLLLRRVLLGEGWIKVFLASVAMLLLRNNAQYALILTTVIILICWLATRKAKLLKIVLVYAGVIIVAGVIGFGLKAITHAESGSPREALSIPIQQMARVKNLYGDILDSEDKVAVDALIDDEAAAKYDAHLADPVKERISMKQPALFVKTWIKLGLKYPGTYIDAWLYTTEGAWYIRDKSCNRIYGEGAPTGFGYLSTDIRNMPEGFEVYNETKIPWLRDFFERIVSDNAFENIPVLRLLFAPALYFWIFVLYIYRCTIVRDRTGIYISLFGLAYFLTIMLSPAILVRYMYPYMLLVFLVFIPGVTNDNC